MAEEDPLLDPSSSSNRSRTDESVVNKLDIDKLNVLHDLKYEEQSYIEINNFQKYYLMVNFHLFYQLMMI